MRKSRYTEEQMNSFSKAALYASRTSRKAAARSRPGVFVSSFAIVQ